MPSRVKACVLKDIDGLIVTVRVRREKKGPELCAVELQTGKNVCTMELKKRETNQMAFCFHHQSGTLCPKVDGKLLKLEKIDGRNLPESHWFEMDNVYGGKHYGLRSMVEPRRYLSLDVKTHTFCLRASRQDSVRVTVEKI